MFGSQDKFKKFNDDVANILKQHRENSGSDTVLSEDQIAAAGAAKEELAEAQKECPLMTLETRNDIIKKHLYGSSKNVTLTPRMVKTFSDIALGG